MSVRVVLSCDECQVTRYELNAGYPARARRQAARGGWTYTDARDARDLCPSCTRVEAHRADRLDATPDHGKA